jgi:hypothetical protein
MSPTSSTRTMTDALPGIGIAIGAGAGLAIGVAIAGAAGLPLGLAIGAGVGLIIGAVARTQRPAQIGESACRQHDRNRCSLRTPG